MKARDVMGTCVISVGPDLLVQAVANTLVKNGISAVPVVDHAGKLLGIVSEGDLVRRAETHTEHRRAWWLDFLGSARKDAADFVKSHGRKAGDVMTTAVVTAEPETSLGDIADLMERHGIKRVPIMHEDQIIGIVSRANLVQALASGQTDLDVSPDDEELREAVVAKLRGRRWGQSMINVLVQRGIVDLWGVVDSEDEKKAVRIAAEETPGVSAVNDNLRVYPIGSGF